MTTAERFPPTRCSVLEQLGSTDDHVRTRAYDLLVRAYWQPIYAYTRLRWHATPQDAQDVTQSFLAAAWSKGYFEDFDATKARFRTFLRVCLDRFVMKQRESENAARRGGGAQVLPLDFTELEGRLSTHEHTALDENELFRQEYIRSLFSRAVTRLEQELHARKRDVVFAVFQKYDLSDGAAGYADIARELGINTTQVTNHLHAARKRFRELVLEEIRAICANDDEYRAEVRDVLGSAG